MAQNLCTAKDKIFIDENTSTTSEKLKAIMDYNSIVGERKYKNFNSDSAPGDIINAWKEINSNRKIDVYTYYEYVQFKRAKFDCVDVDYNEKTTGRIKQMTFKFTEKFE